MHHILLYNYIPLDGIIAGGISYVVDNYVTSKVGGCGQNPGLRKAGGSQMYSQEDRRKAVELYIKRGNKKAVKRELGYPDDKTMDRWHQEYIDTGTLKEKRTKWFKFTEEQKHIAIQRFLMSGCHYSNTVKELGYPSRALLGTWVKELAPLACKPRKDRVKCSEEQKLSAVIDLCTGDMPVHEIVNECNIDKVTLYNWKKDLLGKEFAEQMTRKNKPPLPDDRDALLIEVESLKKQIYRQQLELDVLKKAAEILKKDQGIDLKNLTNKEKATLIDALRTTYPLNDLLEMIEIAKSSYFYQREAFARPDKYADMRTEVKNIFSENKRRYGYRRVHTEIKKTGVVVSEKVVRKIMKEEQLEVPCKKNLYNSYKGEISPAVKNVIARDFHTDTPNTKWLTDITEFHIPAGKVYLSPIIDCFDGLAVSWTIGTSPNAELVNTMLDEAVSCLSYDEHPIVHSDRGGHYRWPGWISRMEKAGLTRSMSKKSCPSDNAACEGFFGRLKNEMFYFNSWQGVSINQFINELDGYLRWYNEKRIKMSLGGLSPLDYRFSIGLAA